MVLRYCIEIAGLGSFVCEAPSNAAFTEGDLCVGDFGHIYEVGEIKTCLEGEPTIDEPAIRGRVLRKVAERDLTRLQKNSVAEARVIEVFHQLVEESQLSARAVNAHFSLRQERLILWYAADATTDLRQVFGQIQRQFGTQVESRLLDFREAAALTDGFGVCGRRLCCATWLRKFQSINVGMARAQDLPLLPGVINGQCGCAKCCLKFEYEQYSEAAAEMPPTGYLVSWKDGEGIVVARDLLARQVTVRAGNRFVSLALSELDPRTSQKSAVEVLDDDLDKTGVLQHEDSDG